jgi:hypothetical protein
VLLAPTAIVAALVMGIALRWLILVSLGIVLATEDLPQWFAWVTHVFAEAQSSACMGVVLVLVAGHVAPTHQRLVRQVAAFVGVAVAGFLLFPAIQATNGVAVIAAIMLGIGAVVGAVDWGRTAMTRSPSTLRVL